MGKKHWFSLTLFLRFAPGCAGARNKFALRLSPQTLLLVPRPHGKRAHPYAPTEAPAKALAPAQARSEVRSTQRGIAVSENLLCQFHYIIQQSFAPSSQSTTAIRAAKLALLQIRETLVASDAPSVSSSIFANSQGVTSFPLMPSPLAALMARVI